MESWHDDNEAQRRQRKLTHALFVTILNNYERFTSLSKYLNNSCRLSFKFNNVPAVYCLERFHLDNIMFLICFIISLFLLFVQNECVLYRLNATEHSRMPLVFDMDDYELCMEDPEGLYCVMKLELVSDGPSSLLDMIHEYSEDTVRHFNHSLLERSTCVTRTCKKYLNDRVDLKSTLGKCFNESLWRDYQLKARVKDDYVCYNKDNHLGSLKEVTNADKVVAVMCFGILMLNIIGTLYDLLTTSENYEGNKILGCFSLRRNWWRLVATPSNSDPRLDRLSSLHGLKCIGSSLIILGHSTFGNFSYITNTHYMEGLYDLFVLHAFLNGALIVQMFFVFAGFLLVYNIELYKEKNLLKCIQIPIIFMLRWLQLSVPYVVALAFTSTWQRFVSSGPAWDKIILQEVRDCQQRWWHHLLYINNYVSGSYCYQHTWYSATDIQLYILGLIVCYACHTTRSKTIILSLLALFGLISPAVHIYYQGLDGAVLLTPKYATSLFVENPSFNILHMMGHNNIIGYVIGMTLGYVVYYLQQNKFDAQRYKKYRILYWSLFPLIFCFLSLGNLFYRDAPRPSILIQILYGIFSKPIFSSIIALLLFGFIFEYEGFYRDIVEWTGWIVPARISYNAYLLHIALLKNMFSFRTTMFTASILQIIERAVFSIFFTYIIALPFSLLVDSPFRALRALFKVSSSADIKKKS